MKLIFAIWQLFGSVYG